ncbi:hypothetical protein BHE74_00008814 [Ensete ventricosum]|nr:hypothetical protein BHE74_00008814 [Ensete ventricosum]RZR79455.1 hypothetical protein BHM03_00005184 [Ensete ventricosum]
MEQSPVPSNFAFLAVDPVTRGGRIYLRPAFRKLPYSATRRRRDHPVALPRPLNVASSSWRTRGFSFHSADAVTGRVTLPPGDVTESDAFRHASPSRPPVRSPQN